MHICNQLLIISYSFQVRVVTYVPIHLFISTIGLPITPPLPLHHSSVSPSANNNHFPRL